MTTRMKSFNPVWCATLVAVLLVCSCKAPSTKALRLRAADGAVPAATLPLGQRRAHSRRVSSGNNGAAPEAPTSVTATRGNHFASVAYQHPHSVALGPNNGTLFRVQASPGPQWAFSRPAYGDIDGAGSAYVTNLDNGESYTFTVVQPSYTPPFPHHSATSNYTHMVSLTLSGCHFKRWAAVCSFIAFQCCHSCRCGAQ